MKPKRYLKAKQKAANASLGPYASEKEAKKKSENTSA